ncbi:MAG: hypothetical protein Q4P72_03985, partial [Eubacteriales bacterium]|nr:hypothetical protein [Eubacteriales bacterium]
KLRNAQSSTSEDQTSAGASSTTGTNKNKATKPSSSASKRASQDKSKSPESSKSNQVDTAPSLNAASSNSNPAQDDSSNAEQSLSKQAGTSAAPGSPSENSGNGNWQFNSSSDSDSRTNTGNNSSTDVPALELDHSSTPSKPNASIQAGQAQPPVYSMVPYEAGNLVKPGGYWYFVPGEDLFGIARYVYASYENPEFYAYKIIEANGLSVINGQVYIATGQALYMPIP